MWVNINRLFDVKIDTALALQAYANKEFDEKQTQRKYAPKGGNHRQ